MAILKVRDENGKVIEIPAIRGKSAYEYAKEGGYTGTEADFYKDLADSELTGEMVKDALGYVPVGSTEVNNIIEAKVTSHNTSSSAHSEIRLLIDGLTTRLNTLANSDDTTLDQMAEVVAYIKNNKSLIDGITTSKVNVSDIIDNLTTSVSNKPLSAKQGVELKKLIDGIVIPTLLSQLGEDSTHRMVTDSEKSIWNSKIGAPELKEAIDEALGNLDECKIFYATCNTEAAIAEKVVTVLNNPNWELEIGKVVMISFSITNTASNVTLNVNGTGAYPIWYNNTEYTSNGSAYTGYAQRVTTYMFNGTHWVWITNSYDANTTYTNVKLGHGYATCSTAEATTAKVGTLSSYTLTTGGIVAVKFTNAVPANSTLNINSRGAKNIYYRGAKITDNVIKAGDVATFIYSSQYHLLSIDRWQQDIDEKADKSNAETWTFTLEDGSTITKKVVLA